MNAVLSSTPAFTTSQLEALVASDLAEVIDWPGIFDVRATPLREALNATFNHPCIPRSLWTFEHVGVEEREQEVSRRRRVKGGLSPAQASDPTTSRSSLRNWRVTPR